MNAISKAAPQLGVAIAILGLVTAGAYTGHFSGAEAAGTIGVLIGLVGVITLGVLNSPQPNADLLPHLIFTFAILGAAGVLLFHDVLTSGVVTALIAPILGGGVAVAASNSTTNAIASLVPPQEQATIPPGFGNPPPVSQQVAS